MEVSNITSQGFFLEPVLLSTWKNGEAEGES